MIKSFPILCFFPSDENDASVPLVKESALICHSWSYPPSRLMLAVYFPGVNQEAVSVWQSLDEASALPVIQFPFVFPYSIIRKTSAE